MFTTTIESKKRRM